VTPLQRVGLVGWPEETRNAGRDYQGNPIERRVREIGGSMIGHKTKTPVMTKVPRLGEPGEKGLRTAIKDL